MARYRPVSPEDKRVIADVCETYFARIKERASKAWLDTVNLNTVMDHIFDTDTYSYIVEDSYLVVFEVGSAWYSTETMLMEQLVLSLRPGTDFSVVTDFLDEQSQRHGTSLITVGTSLAPSDAALARLYSRQGYKQEALALVKRTPNVQLPIRSLSGQAGCQGAG